MSVWETKFLEHSPKNRCPLYVLYKIPLAQANFLLTQLKMYSHWRAGEHKFPSLHVWMSNKNPWKITNINQIKQGTTKQIQIEYFSRADSRFVPSHCNISHWLGARQESVLFMEYTTSWRIQSRNTDKLGRISFSFSCWGLVVRRSC